MHQNGVAWKLCRPLLVRQHTLGVGIPHLKRGCYFFFFAAAARGFLGVAALAGTSVDAAGGLSPITPLSGQILNAGHFLQPTAMAMGQMVMAIPVRDGRGCASMHAARTGK